MSSAPPVAEFILTRLTAWGVGRIYGYPGDGINGSSAPGGRWPAWAARCPMRWPPSSPTPDRPVVVLVGDGAMQMNGMNELITFAQEAAAGWSDPRLIVLVLNNRDLNQVTWEQRVMEGDPKYERSQALPDFSYSALRGARRADRHPRRDAGPHRPAWDEASAEGPVVLDVLSDPEVPPLPPHITVEQARTMTAALAHGDPGARQLIRQTLRQALAGLKR